MGWWPPLLAVVMGMWGCSSKVPLNTTNSVTARAPTSWGPYGEAAGARYARTAPTELVVREWRWLQQGELLSERAVSCDKSRCEVQELTARRRVEGQRIEFTSPANAVVRTAKFDFDGSATESGGLLSGSTRVRFEPDFRVVSLDDVRLLPITPIELARAAQALGPHAVKNFPGAADLLAADAQSREAAKARPSVTRPGSEVTTVATTVAAPVIGPSQTKLYWLCAHWDASSKTAYFSEVASVSGADFLSTKRRLQTAWTAHLAKTQSVAPGLAGAQCQAGGDAAALKADAQAARQHYTSRQGVQKLVDVRWSPAP
jgi:hypothetical protein